MSVITRSNHPKALWPGVRKWFGQSYTEHPEEWKYLFDDMPSDKAYEEYVLSNGFTLAPVKSEGTATTYVSDTQGYTARIANAAYSLGFIVTREELADNQYRDKAFDRAGKLAFAFRQTKETVCANVYNRAFNSTYAGGDGKELLATDHPTISGNQSNELSPAADLSEQALEDLSIQIRTAKSFEGFQISLRPDCLIIPPQLMFEADRILNSTKQSGTANNDLNSLKEMGMFPGGVKVNHYLTDADAFFIRTRCPKGDGMIHQVREKMDLTKDTDFDTDNAKAKAYMRFGVGWSDWKGLWGSQGA